VRGPPFSSEDFFEEAAVAQVLLPLLQTCRGGGEFCRLIEIKLAVPFHQVSHLPPKGAKIWVVQRFFLNQNRGSDFQSLAGVKLFETQWFPPSAMKLRKLQSCEIILIT